jgi:FkbM family methyltransferase
MAHASLLSFKLHVLPFLMRRMPRGIRRVDRWWDRMYRSIGGQSQESDAIDSQWPAGEYGPVRSRRFDYQVMLNLRCPAERWFYFSGECPRQEMEYVFPALLRPGDQYLEIGASIGLTALMASALIERGGRGFAFEPDPDVFPRLARHFERNRASNVELVPYAISDQEREMYLVVERARAGEAGWLATDHESFARKHLVRATSGRAYLDRLDPTKPTIIRIDVEGHEVKVLEGIADALDWREIAIICAVDQAKLRRAGDSRAALYERAAQHGLQPFSLAVRRGRLWARFAITELKTLPNAPLAEVRDVLFAKPDSRIFDNRMARYLTPDLRRRERESRMRIRVVMERSRPPARPARASSPAHESPSSLP